MIASGENRLSSTMMRRMPVLAQSQAPADGLDEITVTGTRGSGDDTAGNFNSSNQLDEITVLGNRGERGWQGNNPDPTKGVKPIRDSNGNIIGWNVRNPQTGKSTPKSLEWGRQNGLDPNDFSVPLPPALQPNYTPPSPDSGAVTLAWLLSLLALFNQFDAYTTVP
jgi:hypothetical protein